MNFKSLRWKILTSLSIAAIIAIAISTVIVNRVLTNQRTQYLETRLTVVSMMAHASLRNIMTQEHQDDLGEFILHFARQAPLGGVRIIGPDGMVTFSSNPDEVERPFIDPAKLQESKELEHFFRTVNGDRVFTSVSPIVRTPACAACHPGPGKVLGYLGVDVPAEELDRSVRNSQNWMIASSLFVFVMFVGTAFGVHFRFVKKRTKVIADGISQLATGNFDYRIPTAKNDELDLLAVRINQLGDRLEQMRQELERSHRSELERAERMASVGELAASIAHEIRNPVAGISSAMQVLSSELPAGDERAVIFEEIVHQTHRVNRAVNDLLSYARPSTPELAVGSINDPIYRALTLMDAQKKAAHVDLITELEPNLPPVLLDVEQSQQVFVNLIMNALQAMPTGGSLKLKTFAEGEVVFAEITDTGPGIPKEILHDIFKPFFTTKHQGTGLGLSICRSIIESHCGTMEVESSRGVGTTFRIRLPVHRIEETSEPI